VALQGPVSTADIAPTVLELVGFEQHGMTIEGQSLVDAIQQGQAPDSPVFFERGTDSAGVIHGDHKLILTPAEAFSSCIPYSQSDGDAFPAELEELYDLAADPGELNNLAETERELLGELRDTTCSWVQQSAFEAEHAMDNNLLVAYCEEHGHPRP
jgi:arylsulfatase A-like enzyme